MDTAGSRSPSSIAAGASHVAAGMRRDLLGYARFALIALVALPACRRSTPAPSGSTGADASPPAACVAPIPSNSAPVAVPEAPAGYLLAHLYRVVDTSQGEIVLLTDKSEQRFLPIFVGGTEALSIRLRHEKHRYPRPLTHDLLDTLVDKLGGRIEKVQIDDIKNKVFIGRVFVRQGDRTFDLDARPSDAIALAVGGGVPVYVTSAVFDTASVPARELGIGGDPDELRVPVRSRPDEPTHL